MSLEGELTRLRALEAEDVDLLYVWENDPAVWGVSGTLAPFSRHTLRRFLDEQRFDLYAARQLRLVVETLDGRAVGLVDLFEFEPVDLRAGIGILTGMTPGRMMWIILLVAVVITFLISSYTGIGKGVRFLSDKNAKLYMGLMLFVILFGPTSYILNNATQAFGFHIEHFFTQSTYLSGFDGEMWPTWWTINYWSWMIAYAPLMGIFLAKIARGRTLREFTIYNFLLPGLFGIVWFGIFGSSAIFYETNGGGIYQSMQELGTESAVFAFFKNMPISAVLDVVFLFTAFLSIVTLCDSMTTTISSLSINAKNAAVAEPPAKIKIFWGITVSLVCFVNLATASTVGNVSGIDATKQLAISTAFPLMFVMILILISGVLMLKNYHKYDTVDHPENSVVDKDLICDFDEDAIM